MASYLDFEKNIQQIDEDIINAQIKGDTEAVSILKKNLEKEIMKSGNILDMSRGNNVRLKDL